MWRVEEIKGVGYLFEGTLYNHGFGEMLLKLVSFPNLWTSGSEHPSNSVDVAVESGVLVFGAIAAVWNML